MSLNEDNPAFKRSKPSAVTGLAEFIQPRPGNNTFPSWFTKQLRLGYRVRTPQLGLLLRRRH